MVKTIEKLPPGDKLLLSNGRQTGRKEELNISASKGFSRLYIEQGSGAD